MLSDNGLQMVGAENALRAMIKGWDKAKLKKYCADRGITWQFTTLLAPRQNGCSESMVKSCKTALKKAIGDALLTPFELYTCLVEVANLLNQLPIGKLSQDPNDGAYLCPNDILLGRATSAVPQGLFRETKNPIYWVFIAGPNAVRGKWQTGKVVRIFPGNDGLTRNVEVKTTTEYYRRLITKLCVIYPADGFKD